nr:MAG TPA: hypothetical protein [Crassvirales sp.]
MVALSSEEERNREGGVLYEHQTLRFTIGRYTIRPTHTYKS